MDALWFTLRVNAMFACQGMVMLRWAGAPIQPPMGLQPRQDPAIGWQRIAGWSFPLLIHRWGPQGWLELELGENWCGGNKLRLADVSG